MQNDVPDNAPKSCPGTSNLAAGSAKSCEGCPNQSKCAGADALVQDINRKIQNKLSKVKNIILIASGKGGVGKSSVTAILAYGLSTFLKDSRVGILDIDLTGPSIPNMMGCNGVEINTNTNGWSPVYVTENLSVMSIGFMLSSPDQPIIWRDPKKNNMITQMLTEVNWCDEDDEDLDFLIIDTPPGTSGEHMTIVSLLKNAEVLDKVKGIFVSTPQSVSVDDVYKQLGFFRNLNVDMIGVVENMSSYRCKCCQHEFTVFPTDGAVEKLCKEENLDLIAQLPLDNAVCYRLDHGLNVFDDSEYPSDEEAINNEDDVQEQNTFWPKDTTTEAMLKMVNYVINNIANASF